MTTALLLHALCGDSGNVEFRNDYSGRGMYGERCVGIVGTMQDCTRVIMYASREVENIEELVHFSTDNTGMDTILYWPSIKPVKGLDEYTEEEEEEDD